MPYLIDGHNLIASLPDIDLADPDDEAKLVQKLRGFVARQRNKCTVIFDGGLPGGFSAMSNASVKVIFAASQHSNADSLLKRRISKIPDTRNWTLVSSDNELRDFARRRQMQLMSSAQFSIALQRIQSSAEAQGDKINPTLSEEELTEWLEIFGDDQA